MKKLTKKVLPVVLAGALVAGMAMPSMAAAPTTAPTIPTDFLTFSADGKKVTDIDMDKFLMYVAEGQVLKNAPAFTNQGLKEEQMNENNLFGNDNEQYGFVSEVVFNQAVADGAKYVQGYADYKEYLAEHPNNLKQAKMTDSIAYLTDADGESTAAPYWWVRHGSNDRDTGFANQTLLKLAMDKNSQIKVKDFAFAYGYGHTGDYDLASVKEFMADSLKDAGTTADTAGADFTAYATKSRQVTAKIDNADVKLNIITDYYLDKAAGLGEASGKIMGKPSTRNEYENAKVDIVYKDGVDLDTAPVLYMVNNGGWQSNAYDKYIFDTMEDVAEEYMEANDVKDVELDTIIGTTNMSTSEDLGALAVKEGYVVVTAGLRTRGMQTADGTYNHSAVTVADAKAVIKYLKANDIGAEDRIFINGTSGGGALSVAVGASGNSADYAAELNAIGAAAGEDDIFGVIAYCPITDLGHADGSYEYTFAGTRADLLAAGFSAESGGAALTPTTMKLSPMLANEWAAYVNGLGVAGNDNLFDTATLTASGTLYNEMEALLLASMNEGLASFNYDKEAFLADIEKRTIATSGRSVWKFVEAEKEDTKPTAPKTGNNMMPLFAVVVAAGAVALASTRRRVVR